MTAQEFKTSLSNDLDKFVDEWEKGNKENESMYPTEINEGDWLDQFLIFLGNS